MPYQPKSEGMTDKFKKNGATHNISATNTNRGKQTMPKDVRSTLKMPGSKAKGGGYAAGVRMPRRPEK